MPDQGVNHRGRNVDRDHQNCGQEQGGGKDDAHELALLAGLIVDWGGTGAIRPSLLSNAALARSAS
jgi:hypothetical protein